MEDRFRVLGVKVNGWKTNNPDKLSDQIKKVSKYLIERIGYDSSKIKTELGLTGDDFVNNKITLRIQF